MPLGKNAIRVLKNQPHGLHKKEFPTFAQSITIISMTPALVDGKSFFALESSGGL